MDSGEQTIKPFAEIGAAFRSLVQRPFSTIFLLELLVAIASASIADLIGPMPSEEYGFLGFVSTFFSLTVSVYLQIAMTLAAGGNGEPSAEGWIRAAMRHRCFWRYIGVTILSILIIMLGLIALVVGAILVGAGISLAQAAVVLERARPVAGINRSTELTRPVRKPMSIMFAVFWMPVIAFTIVLMILEVRLDLIPQMLVSIPSTALTMGATIAFTRVFVKLGGAPTPPLQTLLYKAKAGSPA
jgi:hypothetical protein